MMNHPTELLGDILSTEVAGYSVLQIGVAAVGIALVIGGLRYAYRRTVGG